MRRIVSLFIGLFSVAWRYFRAPSSARYQVKVVEDLPSRLQDKVLYVVREGELSLYASMRCPKTCATTLNMNLLPDDEPRWRLTMCRDGSPSLHPSIWRKRPCGCHFWLEEGQLRWVPPSA